MKNATKAQVKRARDPQQVQKVIREKGFPSGKLPEGKELHHVKPVALGGLTTNRNTRVVSTAKHHKIHNNRRIAGKI